MKKCLGNNRGILTLDFIFASMIVFGFSAIIFSFGITLSVAEVVQYISFSTARNYSLAHLDEDEQRRRGEEKFQELISDPAVRPLFENGWFKTEDVEISDFNDEYSPESDDENFIGARIQFGAPILYKRIPLIGTTGTDPDGFNANIQSFLAREPTFKECKEFMDQRAQKFQNLGSFQVDPDAFVVQMDNGC